MRRSFALRAVASFAVVGVAAAALTAVLVNVEFRRRFSGYLNEQQSARVNQLVVTLADSYQRRGGWDPADLDVAGFAFVMTGGTLTVEDSNGRDVWTLAGRAGPMAMHPEMMGPSSALGPEIHRPVSVGGAVVGTAVVRLPIIGVLPQDAAFRSSINADLLLGGALAAVLAILLGVVLARRVTAPARELTRAARALAAGDRSQRVPEAGDHELREMASAFNHMADAIDEEDRLRRLFATDVAHELRTPLAVLRSHIEGLQDGVIAPTPAALGSLHEEVLRLGRLVFDLEVLASADAAAFTISRRPIDLRALLADALHEFHPALTENGVQLERELSETTIDADPTRIRQVVDNLLSNATKFTPPGGTVHVTLTDEGDQAILRVADSGPGIPPDELPHVFDRFFRGSHAKARGSGIGLAVVRQLVVAHGGTVEAASDPGHSTTLTVRLPKSPSGLRRSFIAPSHQIGTLMGKGERP